jgi:hypothetical protein
VYDHAEVPIHAEHLDAKNIFGAFDRNIGHAQYFFGILDALFSRDELRRPPTGR